MFAGAFGEAGTSVVIEEFMEGEEASLLRAGRWRGRAAHRHGAGPQARGRGRHRPEYRRDGRLFAGAGADARLEARCWSEIVRPPWPRWRGAARPTGRALCRADDRGRPARLVEYNVRFGDPECQVLMMRLGAQALDLMLACAEGRLAEAR
jgi:phosphoribosylamine---glycine ligase